MGSTHAVTPTFLLTDIEGSTRLWEEHRAAMAVALEEHDSILRASVQRAGGTVVKSTGDGVLAVFDEPWPAIEAAVGGLSGLADRTWTETGPLRVRMAIHTGTAETREGDFHGPALNRVARLLAIGHGDQVLISGATAALIEHQLAGGVELIDHGEHHLRDLAQPEHVFQIVAPGLQRDFPPLLSSATRQSNLPVQLTSFIGRETELAELRRLIGPNRLVTLVGVGGTGKTRLMLQAAADELPQHADGAWLVELAPITDPSLVVEEVVRALGAQGRPGQSAIEVALDFLRAKRLLLLVDNCEHLIGTAATVVQQLLGDCPGITVLATSREPLGVAGESIFPVPSLGVPEPVGLHDSTHPLDAAQLAEIGSWESVRLFVDRVLATRPDFALDAASAPAVVEICRRLDGIPLALELAAARMNVLSVDEIAQGLGDRFRLLTGGRRTAVPRQQTLQALIDWSWDLLDDADQRLLRRLSVFAGGWTLDSAVPVAGEGGSGRLDVLDGLSRLVDRSLVVVDWNRDTATATRYRMLETIRQYARDRLVAAGEADAVRSRHLELFRGIVSDAAAALRGPDEIRWLRRLDPEVDNLRAALDWAFESDPAAAIRMTVAMAEYWQYQFVGPEAVERFDQAVEAARSLPDPPPGAGDGRPALLAGVLAAAAIANAPMGRPAVAEAQADEAIELARQSGNEHALFEALVGRTLAQVFRGHDVPAQGTELDVLDLGERLGEWAKVAFAEAGIAAYYSWSDVAAANHWLEKALDAAQRSGNPSALAFVALSRARVAGAQGRLDEATVLFTETLAGYAAIGDRRFQTSARSDFGHALRRAGALDRAEAIYRETIHEWVHSGNRGAIANQLESFAFLAIQHGSMERAARLLGAAEVLREADGAGMLSIERREYEEHLTRLRAALDGPAFERAWSAGRAMTTEEAVAYALADSAG